MLISSSRNCNHGIFIFGRETFGGFRKDERLPEEDFFGFGRDGLILTGENAFSPPLAFGIACPSFAPLLYVFGGNFWRSIGIPCITHS